MWSGCFPVEESRSGWAVVDGLARRYVREGRSTDLERGRADALMDLVHARATGEFVIQLAVPASQVEAAEVEPGSDDVVEVAGLGGGETTHVRREWLESLIARTISPLGEAPSGSSSGDRSAVPHAGTDGTGGAWSAAGTSRDGWSGEPDRSSARQGSVRAEVLACADSSGALLTGPLPQTQRRELAAEPVPVGLGRGTAQNSAVAADGAARGEDWTAWEAELAHQIHAAEKHLAARSLRRGRGHSISRMGYRHRRHPAVPDEPPF